MATGLIGTGRQYLQQAEGLAQATDTMRNKRQVENKMIDQAEKTQAISGVTSGALIGTQIMPGVGTAVGAAVGLLAAKLF